MRFGFMQKIISKKKSQPEEREKMNVSDE